jgi:ring-1,2-phenylacetyl-CoA epoxidase subunit PaaE
MKPKTTFHRLSVREIRRETRDAVSIKFAVPKNLAPEFLFRPGQYLTLKADINGEDIRRNYSICASPLDGELRIAVKALPGGKFSTYANEFLQPGDTLEVLPASGHFTAQFAPDRAFAYAAFAAGSGITPILSIIKTALATEPQSRFKLFYGNRRSSDILFLEELAGLKNRYMARLEIHHFLSMEEEDIALFNGRLDEAKCRDVLQTLIDPHETEMFFICGPEGMMQAAETALRAAGIPPEKILLERFLSASAPQSESALAAIRDAEGRRMSVLLDGRKSTVIFNAALGNILDSVRDSGMPAPYACKGGVCATCRAKVLAGEVEMKINYGLTQDEVAQGYVLTCQSTPKTDGVVISYDA